MGNLVLLPLAGSLFLSRLPVLRELGPVRRLQAVTVVTLLGLLILWFTMPSVNAAIVSGESPPHPASGSASVYRVDCRGRGGTAVERHL